MQNKEIIALFIDFVYIFRPFLHKLLAFTRQERYNGINRMRVCGCKPKPDAGKTVHVS